ncbi:hypothetical protein Patl1_35647 [Pistacia atlantica]|nr:hypothetical protein Patl1_35647 [Pistacia atlantica]
MLLSSLTAINRLLTTLLTIPPPTAGHHAWLTSTIPTFFGPIMVLKTPTTITLWFKGFPPIKPLTCPTSTAYCSPSAAQPRPRYPPNVREKSPAISPRVHWSPPFWTPLVWFFAPTSSLCMNPYLCAISAHVPHKPVRHNRT